jgi:hypothetical protein
VPILLQKSTIAVARRLTGFSARLNFHPASDALDRLRSAQIGRRGWSNDKLCKPAQVLRDGCEHELKLSAAWST